MGNFRRVFREENSDRGRIFMRSLYELFIDLANFFVDCLFAKRMRRWI